MSLARLIERLRVARRAAIKTGLAAAVAVALHGAPAVAADSFSTDWALGAKSKARLIAGDGDLAGFEVALAPGAITYWRDPGDAGVPPTLDFSDVRQCRERRAPFSRAEAHQGGRRQRGVRLREQRRLSVAGETARRGEAGDPQA